MRGVCLWLALFLAVARIQALSLLTYNSAGNGSTDWSTNAPQVQAIGRQMAFLRPDIITFNEIPFTNTWQMANFVTVFLPGYFLATNSATDGFIRSVILSRFPIVRSKSWLHSADLAPYGHTNADFTRDLFEAEVNVPGFDQHLHVFVTHLKALSDVASSGRRAAEAGAISNFFVTGFLTTNGSRPYVLSGDLNEDVARPPVNSGNPIARLVNPATGLQLTTPTNPISGREFTFSIRGTLNARLDYILPGALLASNILRSEVFRTDLLNPTPAGLQPSDSRTASDHLPVLVVFKNPYDSPFQLTFFSWSNQVARLAWQSVPQRQYRLEISSNLTDWSEIVTGLTASTPLLSWTGAVSGPMQFFRVYREP